MTGLEPGTNYPNPKPFEKARGRVVTLRPGAEYAAEMTLEVLTTRAAVAAAEAEVSEIQAKIDLTIHKRPVEPFAPEE